MRKIRLIENGVKIEDRCFHIGDTLKVKDRHGRVIGIGTVDFRIYKDGEAYIDEYHAGFIIDYFTAPDTYFSCRTLPDLINAVKENNWIIEIEK